MGCGFTLVAAKGTGTWHQQKAMPCTCPLGSERSRAQKKKSPRKVIKTAGSSKDYLNFIIISVGPSQGGS
jgi:hypothetical protein